MYIVNPTMANVPFNYVRPILPITNPVQLTPPTVVDYVPTPPLLPPPKKACCTHKVIGIFMMLSGVAVGVGFGLGFGLYYNKCP